jgi:hypothetical protein
MGDSMNRVPLFEYISSTSKPLQMESLGDGKNLFLKGKFIQGEVRNHNGRIYPLSEIRRAVTTLREKIESTGPVLGELDHPEGLNINLDRTSHAIQEMSMDNSDGIGRLRVLNNRNGEIVRSIIEAGVQLGVSSRGSGSVGGNGIVTEFEIITIDIVANPSAPDAHPQAIIESMLANRYGREAHKLAGLLREDRAAQKYFANSIQQYLKEVRDELVWGKR